MFFLFYLGISIQVNVFVFLWKFHACEPAFERLKCISLVCYSCFEHSLHLLGCCSIPDAVSSPFLMVFFIRHGVARLASSAYAFIPSWFFQYGHNHFHQCSAILGLDRRFQFVRIQHIVALLWRVGEIISNVFLS